MRALRRLIVLLTTVLAFTTVTVSPAAAVGDDYPWRLDSTWSADRWGFTKRQCVSFVAWRMAQRGHPLSNATQRWGSAHNWDDAARRLGYGIGTKPVPGSIAHWNPYERAAWYANGSRTANGWLTAGGYGHVGYVQGVYSDGSVSVVQYNLSGNRAYSTTRVKAPRYLYVSVATPR
ncbi:MAG: CHAP domain-containing protein [Frankiales bacterium]|nr:MAG: CHAP domain-containing protein [Frankiales bacterium]